MATAKSLPDGASAIEAWRAIARANANLQRPVAALDAIDRALRLDPDSAQSQLDRALVLEADGRTDESCAALESLVRAAPDSPQLLAHLARALRFAGRDAEAETRVVAGLERWPLDVPLHRMLAEIRWQAGDGARSVARLERAIAEFPGELQLRLVAADLLRSAGALEPALAQLEEGLRRAPGAAAFETSIGALLGDLGRPREALPFLRAAVQRLPGSAPMARNLLPALVGAGEPAEALRIADALLRGSPDDQQLIAWRATALRLLGDPAYDALVDHARLVRVFHLAPPPGYADIVAFNTALTRELDALHRAERRPLAQSIRGGVQTERNLPARNPVIGEFFAALDAPLRDYVGRLDAKRAHPTDRRTLGGYRIAGSWSVRLAPGGFHTNHVHPQGWISSAYYVELPADDDERAGWLKFGEISPPVVGCGPDLYIRPQPGMLVLFPSFLWHGTVPFARGGRRLTAAFDVVPAAAT
ncbi:MAG TPA: putative 2OG-Fe(II) oxygenase [Steroidobacteraceae bacterium]|nr:putative 2OG-Fe(II) oxygenase [Steroidobacteraceae bacterium]